jgi:hypothetical protein
MRMSGWPAGLFRGETAYILPRLGLAQAVSLPNHIMPHGRLIITLFAVYLVISLWYQKENRMQLTRVLACASCGVRYCHVML